MISRVTRQLTPNRASHVGLVLALTASVLTIACDKSPLFAPTQSTVTLAASRLVLPINGVAEIIATVIEQSGTAVQNGTVVTFTTTLGTLDPREARTKGGKVTVRLLAGRQSGTAEVSAFSGDAFAETALEILIGGAAADNVVVTARPGTVSSKGGSVQIIAFVNDENGNRVSGVPVTFTATAGTLSDTSRITNANGEARVTLRTSQQTMVTATAGGKEQTVTVEVNDAPTVTISVGTDPTEDQATDFTLTVGAGSSPIRTVTIDFGDGRAQALGALNGTATVSHVYRSAGTFIVTVTATDSAGESTVITTAVTVQAATAPTVAITTTTTTPTEDLPTTFGITITAGTNPIRRVTVDFGDGRTQSLGATTGTTSVSHVYTSDGTFTVTVTATDTQGVTGTAVTVVTVVEATPPTPLNVTLSATTPSGAPESITFTALVSPAAAEISRFEWDFGDGSTTTTSGSITSHVYTTAATVTVTVTAIASDGREGTGRIEIIIP